MVHAHVREQRYTLAGPVAIDFHKREDLPTGRFLVSGRANAAVIPRPAPIPPTPQWAGRRS
jgi:hypothetical protein